MAPSQPLVGLVGLVVVVALLGGMAFLGISGTDLANYNSSAAKARAIDRETSMRARMDEIDLEAYEKSVEMKTQAERDQVEEEQEYLRRKRALELQKLEADLRQQAETQHDLDLVRVEFEWALRLALVITGSLAALMLCAALTYAAVRFTRSRFPVGGAADTALVDTRALRKLQKDLARRAEMDQRAAGLAPDQQQSGLSEDYTQLFQSKRSKITR